MGASISKKPVVSFLFKSLSDNGVIRVLLTLAQGFIERGLQVEILVIKAQGNGQIWLPAGVKVIELKHQIRGVHQFLYLFALARYLRQHQPAALICGDGLNFASIAKRLARVQTQVVITSHNNLSDYLQHKSAKYRNSLMGYLLRRFLWFYSWADYIVPVSQGVADDLVKIAGRPLERMRVIYNPVVTPELLEKAKQPIDHPWFAPGQPPVILGVGRFEVQKDFPTLIRAFALVQQQMPVRLMILGEGQERPQLEALIHELGLAAKVALPGFVSNPYAFMSKAAAFVLSSVHEGLPTVLIEAIATGTPAVSTDCPSGPAEILNYGHYGRLVPVGDVEALAEAILTTLTQPTDTQALRQQAQKFSDENAVNSYLELLQI